MTNEITNNRGYIAFDPGHTTGWASFGPDGLPKRLEGTRLIMGQIAGQKGLYDLLDAVRTHPRVVICEEYVILDYNHFGEKVETIQTIGILKSFAFRWNARWIEQSRTIKPIAYGMAKSLAPHIKAQGAKGDSHRKDAFAHGVYYLTKQRILKPVPPKIS